jgi:uncharacterized protein (DUF1810 family)
VSDPFDLERFVSAQGDDRSFGRVLSELRDGRKTGHWMWYVFPQMAGLGSSAMSRRYAISSLDEARAYVAHPVLGARLRESAAIVDAAAPTSAEEIFGSIDTQKLRSSMTLFLRAVPDEPVFAAVVERYYGGEPDPATDRLLGA